MDIKEIAIVVSKKEAWVPALEDEIIPSLPLHNDGYEWILAHYGDGSKKNIHLKELFLNAHKIKRVELKEASSTAALYRILLSISYRLLPENDFPQDRDEWNEFKGDLLVENEGFDPDAVEKYFDEFEDRFYMIHPTFPFMQDPSLYKFYNQKASVLEDEDRRKGIANDATTIRTVYPLSPSTNKQGGEKVSWGLPEEEVYSVKLPAGERISLLMTSLLHHSYSHSATNRGTKSYENSPSTKNNDAYHKAHYYRCAIHYIPQGDSLFQTLIVPLDFVKQEILATDLPIWEEEVNDLGFLKYYGYNVPIEDLTQSLSSPRSSVNSTHLSMLFFPEYNKETSTLRTDGGQVKQMRRVLINLKFKDSTEAGKISFPRSWNPFVAIKEETQMALKQVSGISPKTSMRHTNLFKIPLYQEVEGIIRPSALKEYHEYRNIFDQQNRYVNVHVLAADASKDTTYSNVSFTEPSLTSLTQNEAEKEKLDNWFTVAGSKGLRGALYFQVKNALSRDGKAQISDGALRPVDEMFWSMYSELYTQYVTPEYITPVGSPEVKKILRENVEQIYKVSAGLALSIDPVSYSKHHNYLMGKFEKTMQGKS